MGVVIVGGNECMVCQYEKICKQHGCKAKVFAKESGSFKRQVGTPDLMVLFTNTVSHKMVKTAMDVAKKKIFEWKEFTPAVQLLYTLFWQTVWDKRVIM